MFGKRDKDPVSSRDAKWPSELGVLVWRMCMFASGSHRNRLQEANPMTGAEKAAVASLPRGGVGLRG